MQILFQYRTCEEEGKTLFIAEEDEDGGKRWEVIIDLPHKEGHLFWNRDQLDSEVIKVSKKLAKKHNAPEWVYKKEELNALFRI